MIPEPLNLFLEAPLMSICSTRKKQSTEIQFIKENLQVLGINLLSKSIYECNICQFPETFTSAHINTQQIFSNSDNSKCKKHISVNHRIECFPSSSHCNAVI